jgi:hypothetical protein
LRPMNGPGETIAVPPPMPVGVPENEDFDRR